jgi:muramoyltetrapeptide carboxypeptidase
MFRASEIYAIICSQGGDSAEQVLPYLDWDVIRLNPKVLIGISDITVLLNAVNRATGLITFHGNDVVWGLGRHPQSYDREAFIARIIKGEVGLIPPNRERYSIRGGCAEGRLLGGNLRCLLKLRGTPYFPDFSGAILFLEAYYITEQECASYLAQLEMEGVFEVINGVVVGYIHSMQTDGRGTSMVEVMLDRLTTTGGFPILKVNDFGHNCPNTVLPVGSVVKIDADNQTFGITEPYFSTK